MKNLTVLGSTGSIGTSTLDVIRRNCQHYSIFALAAGRNVDLLVNQVREFHPKVVVVPEDSVLRILKSKLAAENLPIPELRTGPQALVEIATAPEVDFVMSAIVGVAGLEATYEAICHKKTIGLANKEVLVASGELVMAAAKKHQVELLPVDSEHNGAHQCLRAGRRAEVTKLILTASGGPFRLTLKEKLADMTPAQALNHPTWKMGKRITIDSATLINKGFEVIEACWLFDFQPKEVEVTVHPQSKVHAMVEYNDGSVIAQICATDMRMPIQYALTYPDRAEAPVPRMNWNESHSWQFDPPELDKFPLLRLAYAAQETGGTATCTLNAADEIAVEAFLQERIPFTGIAQVVEETLNRVPNRRASSVQEILEIDKVSRGVASEVAREMSIAIGSGR